jgi:CheY-like chemotaxis protein
MDTGNTKHRLLLVDGDPKSLRVLGVSLRKAGFAVVTATSGREALAALEAELPSLIISDTDLDEIDGFELCRQIKAKPEWAKIPFLFVSGRKSIEDKIRGLELGVDDYLTKPIYIKEIGIRVRTALQRVQRERLESRRDGRTKFAGDLSDIGVVDLVQTIDVNRKSGIVHIVNRDGRRGAVFFRDGNVIDAEVGHLAGVDAMYRLFSWSEGRFEVEFKPIRRKDVIDMPSAGLLMEGMRRLDEWTRLLESLPPLDSIPEVDVPALAEQLGDLPDEMNGVLRLCDGNRSLLAVVDDSEISDLEALTLISRLFAEKILFTRIDEPRVTSAEDPGIAAWLGEGDPSEVAPASPAPVDAPSAFAALNAQGEATPSTRTLPPPPPWLAPAPGSQPQEGPTPRVTLRSGVPLLGGGANARQERDTPQVLPIADLAPKEGAAGWTTPTSVTQPGFAVDRDPPLAEAPWPLAKDRPSASGTGVPELVPQPEERITSEYGSRAPIPEAQPSLVTSLGQGEPQQSNASADPAAAEPTDSPRPMAPAVVEPPAATSAVSSESPELASLDPDGTDDGSDELPSGSPVLLRRLGLGTLALGLVALAALAPRWIGSHDSRKGPTPALSPVDAQNPPETATKFGAELTPADASVRAPDARAPEPPSPREVCLKIDDGGKGRPKAVLTACRPAVKATPQAADLLLIMARAELDRGKAEESRDWAKQAIDVDPGLGAAYIFLGTAEQELGNKGEAKAAYQKYLQLVPTGRRARELRAVLDNL